MWCKGSVMEIQLKAPEKKMAKGQVHCPMCTHSVSGEVVYTSRWMKIVPGQKCERCGASLDAAAVLYLRNAA
jgi:hypothetical protein